MYETTLTVDGKYAWSEDYHRSASLLGVNPYDRNNPHFVQKIARLMDYARRKSKNKSLPAMLNELEKLRKLTGLQAIGKELVTALDQRIRLSDELQTSEDRQAAKPQKSQDGTTSETNKEKHSAIKEADINKLKLEIQQEQQLRQGFESKLAEQGVSYASI